MMPQEHSIDSIAERSNPPPDLVAALVDRLGRIESKLEQLIRRQTIKAWYTTDEVAELLDKAPFTVREWCRQGRTHASKRDCGRGTAKEWVISHDELMRLQSDGLLPQASTYRHVR